MRVKAISITDLLMNGHQHRLWRDEEEIDIDRDEKKEEEREGGKGEERGGGEEFVSGVSVHSPHESVHERVEKHTCKAQAQRKSNR